MLMMRSVVVTDPRARGDALVRKMVILTGIMHRSGREFNVDTPSYKWFMEWGETVARD